MNRLTRLGSEALWVASGQLLALVGGFATIKLLTVELGPAAYGQLALGISVAGVLQMFLYGPIEQVILRFVSVYRERRQMALLTALVWNFHARCGAIALAAIGILALALDLLVDSTWAGIVPFSLLWGLGMGVGTSLSATLTALRQRAMAAIFQVSDVWLRLLFSAIGLALFGISATVAIAAFFLATLVTVMVQYLCVRKAGLLTEHQGEPPASVTGRRAAKSEIVTYAYPYLFFAAFAWISTYSDRWLTLAILGESAVGIYAALYQIANAPIALFVGVTNQFLVPLIFDRAGAGTTGGQLRASGRLLGLAIVAYIVAIIGIVGATALLAAPLVRIVTSEFFVPHAGLLWIMCAGIGLASTGQLLVIKGLSHGQSHQYILPKVVQLAVLIASLTLLVESSGLMGIAWSLCLSGASYLIAVMIANRRLVLPSA